LVELARQSVRPEKVVAWVYRVVKHRALNAARSAQRRRARESHAMAERLAALSSADGFDRGDTLAVTEALEKLAPEDREIVVMRIWGELTYEQIGEALGSSTSSAHRHYERALKSLREVLESPCSTNENRASSK